MTIAGTSTADHDQRANGHAVQLKRDVAAAIAPFDKVRLLKRAAALQLVPENSHAFARLEYLAAISIDAAATPTGPVMSNKRFAQLLSDGPIGMIAQMED